MATRCSCRPTTRRTRSSAGTAPRPATRLRRACEGRPTRSAAAPPPSPSATSARAGAAARRPPRWSSTGACCSRRSRCSTTSSSTRPATSSSWTTRAGSGRSSSATCRATARRGAGCARTAPRFTCRRFADMAPRVAVVGHVEQIQFAVVERLPPPGEVVHASNWFTEAGGGGAVAAVQLRKLAGAATLLTALGSDGIAHRLHAELERRGVTVHAALRPGPHRRGYVHLDAAGERTITIMGSRIVLSGDDPLPWDELAACDAVHCTAGDAEAVRRARGARVLVATARAADALVEAGVEVDALVASAVDRSERPHLARLRPAPRHVLLTEGA